MILTHDFALDRQTRPQTEPWEPDTPGAALEKSDGLGADQAARVSAPAAEPRATDEAAPAAPRETKRAAFPSPFGYFPLSKGKSRWRTIKIYKC